MRKSNRQEVHFTPIAKMCPLVPQHFRASNYFPRPANDFEYTPREDGTHRTAWVCMTLGWMDHPDYDYKLHVSHIYPEHDNTSHRKCLLSDDEVHFYSLCDCKPSYEFVNGDERLLLVVHNDRLHGDDPRPIVA